MELRMTEVNFPQKLEFNYEEIKQEVTEKVALYKNLVYTDDQIKEAKADRAKLNNFVKVLEDKRKEIKKQCLQPYEDFERQIKEIVSVVNEPIALIDKQIKEADRIKKEEKLEKIKELWESYEHPDDLPFERVFNERMLNVSFSMKHVEQCIKDAIMRFNLDIETLAKLPEFGFEATQVYLRSFDINQALAEGRRMSEIARAKAEREARAAEEAKKREEEQARQKAEAEERRRQAEADDQADINKKITEAGEMPENAERNSFEIPADTLPKQWVSFSALLSMDDAVALKGFFASRNIEFKAV